MAHFAALHPMIANVEHVPVMSSTDPQARA
jgi:hypothetical protein